MTIREMKKVLTAAAPVLYDTDEIRKQALYSRLKYKPFWYWSVEEHKAADRRTNGTGDCCFQHIMGLPRRGNKQFPLFDYQKLLFDKLQETNCLWIKKATGIGATEFLLRYIVWLCTRDNEMQGQRVCVVTGPRIDLAVTLIDRLCELFLLRHNITFSSKETLIEINGCIIEAYPSHHLDAMRGLTGVRFILLDEADFFPVGQQQAARDVSERYIAKSGSQVKIVMVSTPDKPGGLFERIEHENPCIYHKMILDYTYGLGRIFTEEDIAEAMKSPSFDREYRCMYLGGIGNVWSETTIQQALRLGSAEGYDPFNPDVIHSPYGVRAMGVDCGFGSSKFSMTVVQAVSTPEHGDQLQVLLSESHQRADFSAMVNRCVQIMRDYGFLNYDVRSSDAPPCFVDGSSPGFVRSLRAAVGLDPEYEGVMARAKRAGFREPLDRFLGIVRPRNFGAGGGRAMLSHLKSLLDQNMIAIHPTAFPELVISLRSAYADGDSLDKDRTSESDHLDSLMLACSYFRLQAAKKR
jgi:hypothetical protein